jgi:NADH dehydrogenase (ubiquinone) 1 alpha/beta subcomplex 1
MPMPAMRTYYPDNVLMKREPGEYYADPMDVAERVVRMFALHDNVADPGAVTLNSTFADCGLNALDMAEIFIALEREFDLEIDEDVCESLSSVSELVEMLSKNPATK